MGVFQPVGLQRKPRLAGKVGHAHHGADAAPLPWRDDGDSDHALFRRENAHRVVAPEPVDPRPLARAAKVPRDRGLIFGDIDRRFVQADGKPPSPPRSAVQPAGRGDEGGQTSDDGGLVVGGQDGWSLGRAGQHDQAGKSAHQRFGRGMIAIGAAVAEPGNRGDGQSWMFVAQAVMREGRSLDRSRRASIQQDIGPGQQSGDRLRGVRHAALVGVQPGEQPALTVFHDRWECPQWIAAVGFQLDDIGTKIGKQLAAVIQPDTGADLQNTVGG